MARNMAGETSAQTLGGGSFYGSVRGRLERHHAIFTDLQHASPRRLPSHAHELAFFALLLDGSYGERYRHRDLQFGPFTIMFRPAGIPHQDEIGPRGVKFFEIELRPAWKQRMADCSGLELPHEECRGGEMLWLAMKLYREMHRPESAVDLVAESLLSELIGATCRLSDGKFKDAPGWLGGVVEKLKTEFCTHLTLEELGQEADVHPVHLSRVFRRCIGEGVGEYVRRLRIRKACEQMLRPAATLADISFGLGFADQSHFTRAFRRITGMSPSAFRRIIRT